MTQRISKIMLLLLLWLGFVPVFVRAETLAQRVAGKVLLQVEESGEAWYVSPESLTRFYLGRPLDAFSIMRNLGLGITSKEFAVWYNERSFNF